MIEVAIGTQNRVYFRTRHDTMSFVKASALQGNLSGFRVGHKAFLKVRYLETGKVVYHRYEGGPIWMGTVPNEIGRPGQRLNISTALLTTSEFVENVPPINLKNRVGFSWLPDECQILRFSHNRSLRMVVQQQPAVEGVSKFDVSLEPTETLGFGPGKGCYLEAKLPDFFRHFRQARIYHDGHSNAWVGLRQGRKYPRISLLSFDGVRLRIAYGSPQIRVASVYLAEPTSLYFAERTTRFKDLDFKKLSWKPWGSYRISLRRELERKMLQSKFRYPHGRIGSEIAYSIANRELDLDHLILNDPSEGGADMMTADGRVVFENRLVTITEAMSNDAIERQIEFELGRLKKRLRSDLVYYQSARVGWAFLSFMGIEGLGTMMFEMKRS